MRFRPILRRLFKPVPLTDDPMPLESAPPDAPVDPITIALDAAVAAHELAGARERRRYAGDLLTAIDQALAKLDRDKDSRH